MAGSWSAPPQSPERLAAGANATAVIGAIYVLGATSYLIWSGMPAGSALASMAPLAAVFALVAWGMRHSMGRVFKVIIALALATSALVLAVRMSASG